MSAPDGSIRHGSPSPAQPFGSRPAFWFSRFSRSQWLLGGGFLFLAAWVFLVPDAGTPWQSVSGLAFSPDGQKLAIGIYRGRYRRDRNQWYFADVEHVAALATCGDSRPPPTILGRERRWGIVNMLPEIFVGPSVALSSDRGGGGGRGREGGGGGGGGGGGDRTLASAGFDGAFDLWDVATGRLVGTRSVQMPHVRTFAAIPGRNGFVTTFRYWLWLWSVNNTEPELLETGLNIQSVALSREGTHVALGGFGPFRIEIWDIKTKRRTALFERPGSTEELIRSLQYGRDGKTLIVATDQAVHVLDVASGATITRLSHPLVLSLAVSPDGRHLATARYDGVTLWDLSPSIELSRRRHWDGPPAESVEFSPDGRLLAAGATDGSVRMWDVNSGVLERSWNFPHPLAAEFLRRLRTVLILAWVVGFLSYLARNRLKSRGLWRDRFRQIAAGWARGIF